MRTNIVIEDQLMDAAMKATGLETKRAVVEEGLRLLVRFSEQARIKELWGTIDWKGDLDSSRAGHTAAQRPGLPSFRGAPRAQGPEAPLSSSPPPA